jgi:hypothetical protein
MDNSNPNSHDSNTDDEIFESEVAKVEVGDNFVVIFKELENGDPFYVVLCDRHYINVKQHLKMIGGIYGMRATWFYTVYGTTTYLVSKVKIPHIDYHMVLLWHMHTLIWSSNQNSQCYLLPQGRGFQGFQCRVKENLIATIEKQGNYVELCAE